MLTVDALFSGALLAYLAGAIAALAAWRYHSTARVAGFALALAGSILQASASGLAIIDGVTAAWRLPFGSPLFPWTIRIDALSAYFNLALAVLACAVSVYSFGYLRHVHGKGNVGALAFFYNVLLLSLTLVFCAGDAFSFLVAWEVMALAAYCLVSFEHDKQESRRAGALFLVMSHAGTGLLLVAFLMLASYFGSLDFSAFHLLASQMPSLTQGIVFVLFFLGFGVKAGIVPLHIWMPKAHPVCPSNISALMSGIVIKTGIYGMARVFFDFFGTPPLWAGTLVLTVGVVSALLGVLYALMEQDLKRLLAYSSIENIGVILMGFGASLMFRALGHVNLAAIALIAGLYHTLNHAMFKGLLFLAAGSVYHSTGTRNMERMGGLIRRMPATALLFLIGAVAISGLPPLNGFASEWLTYQALLAGFGSTEKLTRMMFPIAGSLLALTAALVATCFVKAFGIPFLALPRSAETATADEADPLMRAGMGVLAAACLALGLGATWFLPAFDPITDKAMGVRVSSSLVAGKGFAMAAGSPTAGTVSPAGIALLGVALAGLAVVLVRLRSRGMQKVTGPTWDCGLPGLTSDNQYTATAFSKPLRMIFSALYRPRRDIQAEYEVSPYYPTAIRFESDIEPAFEKHFYTPVQQWILGIAARMRGIQAGSIHSYLAYIFVTLILLLLFGVRG